MSNKKTTFRPEKGADDLISRNLLQLIIDNTNAAIYLKDLQGRYILVNKQYEDLFNVTRDQMNGQTDYDIFPRDIADAFVMNDKEVVATGQAMSVEETVRFKGEVQHYISNKFPIYNDSEVMVGVCGISTDITAIIKARNEIERNQENFMRLVSNIQGVVYRCEASSDWEMHFISDYIETLSGYPASDFISNHKRSFSSIIHPEDKLKVEKAVARGLKDKTSYLITYRIVDVNGEIHWVHEKGKGAYSLDEDQVLLDGVIVDITAEKNLEQLLEKRNFELKEINDKLEDRILNRTNHLKESNDLLSKTIEELKSTQDQLIESRKMEAVGSLVKGICHEISTPLGSALMMSTYLLNEIEKTHDDKLKLLSNDIIKSINSSIEIIDKLRVLSSYPNHKELISFDLNDYLQSVLRLLRKDISQSTSIKFSFDDQIMVKSYPGIIFQVVESIVTNAELHAFKNRDENLIEIKTLLDKDKYKIVISDNGRGINEDILSDIYNPFFTTQMGKNSGLGLYMAYNLTTQSLNGSIECTSKQGQGTSFIIECPLKIQV